MATSLAVPEVYRPVDVAETLRLARTRVDAMRRGVTELDARIAVSRQLLSESSEALRGASAHSKTPDQH